MYSSWSKNKCAIMSTLRKQFKHFLVQWHFGITGMCSCLQICIHFQQTVTNSACSWLACLKRLISSLQRSSTIYFLKNHLFGVYEQQVS